MNFKIVLFAIFFTALSFTQINGQSVGEESVTYPYKFKFGGNPLVSHISSTDPDVHVWDGVVWMYCSQDHPMRAGDPHEYAWMDGYHAFSSTDLINWTDHGEVIHSRDIPWGAEGWMWAPAAARKDGKYYLYYPHCSDGKTWLIGVAVAESPAGPFKDIGHPIPNAVGMDPMVFIDDDGEAYLYSNVRRVAKLKPNMIELAEPQRMFEYAPKEVMDDPLRRLGEGPHMHKKDGVYYYSYSNPKNPEYQGYYGVADNPYGPFEWKGAFVPKPSGAQDHHSIIEFKGQWYIFYHMNTPSEELKAMGWNGIRRIACFDKFYHNPDGSLKMVEHTMKKKKNKQRK